MKDKKTMFALQLELFLINSEINGMMYMKSAKTWSEVLESRKKMQKELLKTYDEQFMQDREFEAREVL